MFVVLISIRFRLSAFRSRKNSSILWFKRRIGCLNSGFGASFLGMRYDCDKGLASCACYSSLSAPDC